MACLNINSLWGHIDQLRLFLDSTAESIDILAINETKLDSTVSDKKIELPGFEVVRRDRVLGGGGVCIYLRTNINFRRRPDLCPDELECLTVEIIKPHSKGFLVSTWYRPESPVALFNVFENMIGQIDSEGLELYLLGDLNCEMRPHIIDHNRKHIVNVMDIYGLHQLINEPTRITATSESLIDLCLTNCSEKITHSGVLHLGISDHSLVFMTRKSKMERSRVHKAIQFRSLKNFCKADFLADLAEIDWKAITGPADDPNKSWQNWKSCLMSVIDKHAPIRHKRIRGKKCPWISHEVLQKMRVRDFLKSSHAQTKDPAIWLQYKKARNTANSALKAAKRKYFSENLETSAKNQRKTWKLLNELLSKQPSKSAVAEIKLVDKVLGAAPDIAEALNTHFTNVGANLARGIPSTSVDPLSYLIDTESSFSFQKITANDVANLISKLDTKKATGLDNIPGKFLKMAGDIVAPSLSAIFNQSMSTGIFPFDWKKARVTPIFKNGNKTDPNNYRPISVISLVAKIFEKLIHDQIYEYLNKNNLLANCQSGFRPQHSTLTAMLEASNSWCINIDQGLLNGVIFIDLKKAFDTLDHEILIRKLSMYGFDRNSVRWFESYLSSRTQVCNVNGYLSNAREIKLGVPQGSLLGPLLFLLYINDLPNALCEGQPRMYADDTSISFTAPHKSGLQSVINEDLKNVNVWLKANKLSLNVAKTEFMVIGSRQRLMVNSDAVIHIHIEDKEIKQVETSKSLGLTIDETLGWSKHVMNISKKISAAIGALKRIRSFIDQKSANTIYKALIEPHFSYCAAVFDGLSEGLSDKLQKLQNRAARIVTNASYDASAEPILDMLGWQRVSQIRTKQKAVVMYKTINELTTPSYLQSLFKNRELVYNVRNSENILQVPKPKTDYGKRSFSYSGATLWNGLPVQLRRPTTLSHFKKGISEHVHGKHVNQYQ